MIPCPLCKFGESRGEGSFGRVLSCEACLRVAQEAEVRRSKKREERGGTCDACKRRPATLLQGGNLTPTGAYKSEHLCTECGLARLAADQDQAREALKRFGDDPDESWPGDDQP